MGFGWVVISQPSTGRLRLKSGIANQSLHNYIGKILNYVEMKINIIGL